MADIVAGEVNVAGGRYEVVLRPVGGNGANRMNGEANVNMQMGGKKKKQEGGKKTRKLSGYMKFAQKVRPEIIKEDPSLKSDIPGIGRKIGEMWRALSAEEKAKY